MAGVRNSRRRREGARGGGGGVREKRASFTRATVQPLPGAAQGPPQRDWRAGAGVSDPEEGRGSLFAATAFFHK